jgi:hypothetical protein
VAKRAEWIMGTQFSSRLTPSDRSRIREGITRARTGILGGAGLDTTIKLTKSQSDKIADAIIREVLLVAERRDFFLEFEQSELFIVVLQWLRELFRDAKFNNFQGIIRKYNLEAAENIRNPVPQLIRELKALTEATDTRKEEKFRVAITNAAKAVLSYVFSLQGPKNLAPDDTQAKIIGKKLGSLSVKETVTRYIEGFIGEVVSMIISSSDPSNESNFTQAALSLTERSATRIAHRIISKVIEAGKLNDNTGIRQIVADELRIAVGIEI